jgi:glycerophosphoryl diester phosphodiesterase
MSTTSFSAPLPGRPEVHGHRGCRGLLPENTLPAFLHALALGVDVLEMDVIISADQQVVVSHEPWLASHLGPGPSGEQIRPEQEQSYNLFQLPYSVIRRCSVGEWPHPGFPTQQTMPTYRPLLRQVLQATESASQRAGREPVGYSIELKSTPAGDALFHPLPARFVELVLAEIHAAGVASRTTLLCFDARILQAARGVAPGLALCLLSEEPVPAPTLFSQLGFVPDVYGPDFRLLTHKSVRSLYTSYPDLRLVPWTVNEPEDFERIIGWGVSGITTDFPDRLLHVLNKTE